MGLDTQVVDAEQLIVKHLDLWTSAQTAKSTAGRGSNNKIELTGIKKLRELILELAVRGKLVPQDPNDEPASKLLKRIQIEKETLIKSKVIRKTQDLPPINEDEVAFELPNGWSLSRLGVIGDWGAGATPNRSRSEYYGGDIPWFKSGELTADFIDSCEENVTALALQECSLRRNKIGDVLIAMYGATIGKASILNVEGTTNQAVCACTPFSGIVNTYLLTLLKACKPKFISMGAGGAQPNISREKIIAFPFMLPPVNEQKRIVVKVEELMALCDQLEQQSYQSIDAHNQLVDTLLQTLVDSANADELASNWQRLSEHFDTLFTTEYSIDALKQTILQLAVMGKLVKQDQTDEPASELLKRIAKEKEALVKAGKIRKQKTLPAITDDEKPFELPVGWKWCRISNLALSCDYGTSQKSYESDDGIPVISMGQIQAGGVLTANLKRVPHDTPDIDDLFLKNGDLLYNRTNSAELVGKTGMFSGSDDLYTYASYLIRIRLPTNLVSPHYLNAVMNSPKFRELEINPHVKQQCGQANVNGTIMQSMRIPLPPYAEQLSVVAKIEELIDLSNQFMEQLSLNKELLNNLTSALLRL